MHQGIIFLIALGVIWIFFAAIQDFKKREVANWLNFSLIIFAIGARFFYCLFSNQGFAFFYQGIIGLGIFFVLGNFFYYIRVFAGGDAKLMIALGAILPFSDDFFINLEFYALFLCIFFITGAIYGLVYSLILTLRNIRKFKKEFSRQIKLNKKLIYILLMAGLFILSLGFFENIFVYFGLLVFVFPFLYIYAKSVEEGIMILDLESSKLSEGDWLYRDLKIGKKVIKASWDGLSKADIKAIKKKFKKVKIKQGIPFIPVFLISFIIFVLLYIYFPFEYYGILFGSHIFPLGLSIFSIF
jgi:Flp pilus assembly protein protease CpaA